MNYILDKNNRIIGWCDYEPDRAGLELSGQSLFISDLQLNMGQQIVDGIVKTDPTINVNVLVKKSRKFRDSLRNKLDLYMKPASTYKDIVITEDQRQDMIKDSINLARWPAQDGWPFINLPVLSEISNTLLNNPVHEYKE